MSLTVRQTHQGIFCSYMDHAQFKIHGLKFKKKSWTPLQKSNHSKKKFSPLLTSVESKGEEKSLHTVMAFTGRVSFPGCKSFLPSPLNVAATVAA